MESISWRLPFVETHLPVSLRIPVGVLSHLLLWAGLWQKSLGWRTRRYFLTWNSVPAMVLPVSRKVSATTTICRFIPTAWQVPKHSSTDSISILTVLRHTYQTWSGRLQPPGTSVLISDFWMAVSVVPSISIPVRPRTCWHLYQQQQVPTSQRLSLPT